MGQLLFKRSLDIWNSLKPPPLFGAHRDFLFPLPGRSRRFTRSPCETKINYIYFVSAHCYFCDEQFIHVSQPTKTKKNCGFLLYYIQSIRSRKNKSCPLFFSFNILFLSEVSQQYGSKNGRKLLFHMDFKLLISMHAFIYQYRLNEPNRFSKKNSANRLYLFTWVRWVIKPKKN